MTKTTVTQAEFNKKVEIESAHLTYMDRIPKGIADQKAVATISEKFQVQ